MGAIGGAADFAILYPLVKERYFHDIPLGNVIEGSEWVVPIIAAPLLAAVSAWLPSLVAAQKDPADVLRHD